MEQEKISVCAYCRVSTDSRDQLNSLQHQKEYFVREIRKNENYTLIDVYYDEGITGTSFKKRENFLRMLYDAGIDVKTESNIDEISGRVRKEQVYYVSDRTPLFNIIFVKNTSRFARNVLVADILRKLKQKNVYVYFCDINKSTENEADELLIQMLFSLDENESKDKARKVRFGMHEEMLKGKVKTNGLIYGYDYNKETKQLEINEEEAKNIKIIFELYASGLGTRRIVNQITEMGIRTKKGHRFNISSIREILKRETYIGVLIRNRWDNGTIFNKYTKGKQKPKEEWLVFKDAVPRIISDELFYKCQELLEQRYIRTGEYSKRGVYIGKTKYAGKIQCGKCGGNYSSRGQSRDYKFYNCRRRQREGVDVCNNPNVSSALLDENMDKLCNGGYYEYLLSIKQSYYSMLDEIKLKIVDRYNSQSNDEAEKYKVELNEHESKLERLIDIYTDGTITKEQFNVRKENLDKTINSIKQKIKTLTATNEEILKELQDIDKVKETISEVNNKRIYSEQEMLEEIEKIVVTEDPYESKNPLLDYIFKTRITIDNLVRKYIAD